MTKNKLKIIQEKGRRDIIITHEGRKLRFILPVIGPTIYHELEREMKSIGLRMPTLSEYSSLLYAIWHDPKNLFSKKVIETLDEGRLFTSTTTSYSSQGLTIMEPNNPKRFIPYDRFRTDYFKGPQISESILIKTLMGKEQAKKLHDASRIIEKEYNSMYNRKLTEKSGSVYVFGLKNFPKIFNNTPQTRNTSISHDKTDIGNRYGIHINCLIDERDLEQTKGYGIGILD